MIKTFSIILDMNSKNPDINLLKCFKKYNIITTDSNLAHIVFNIKLRKYKTLNYKKFNLKKNIFWIL